MPFAVAPAVEDAGCVVDVDELVIEAAEPDEELVFAFVPVDAAWPPVPMDDCAAPLAVALPVDDAVTFAVAPAVEDTEPAVAFLHEV